MTLSERGYRKIKAYEGYGRKTADGGCVAYREKINGKLDVWTIGYGCTKGIEGGTVWTKEQAEAGLRAEIAKHEARVTRLVTIDLNQNETDALISADYNAGALTDDNGHASGLLRALNAGDKPRAMRELARWNKFGGQPCSALTARRADEIALFLERTEPAEPNTMPQDATPSAPPLTASHGAGAVIVAGSVVSALPAPPAVVTDALTNVGAWSDMAHSVQALGPWVLGAVLAASAGWWIFKGAKS